MATTTNFGWETPDDTDLVKDGAAAIRTALGGVDTSFVDLKGGTTGQVLSKASNTDLDYAWVTTDDANAIQNAIVDAKGDLITATAADTPARLAVGTNGQILTADSTAATGIKWADAAGGGGMTLLSTTTLSSTSTTVSSISGSYKHLMIQIKGAYLTGTDAIRLRLNGDSASNYTDRWIRVIGTTIDSDLSNNAGFYWAISSTNTDWSNTVKAEAWVWRYTDTSELQTSMRSNGYNGSSKTVYFNEGTYNASAAVTSVTVYTASGATFSAGTLYIYGVN